MNFINKCLFTLFIVVDVIIMFSYGCKMKETRIKIVYKNVSQGCDKIRISESKKTAQPSHSTKVARHSLFR